MSITELAGLLGLILSGITLITHFITLGIYLGKLDGFKTLVNYRFKNLEEKQDRHNNLVERVYATEKDVSVIKEQIKVENHRISDLEGVKE